MKSLLLSLISFFLPILKPLVQQLLMSAGQSLAIAAQNAVKWVADNHDDLGNAEKREKAFEIIGRDLKQQGIDMAASTINAAIEATVVKLKSGEK